MRFVRATAPTISAKKGTDESGRCPGGVPQARCGETGPRASEERDTLRLNLPHQGGALPRHGAHKVVMCDLKTRRRHLEMIARSPKGSDAGARSRHQPLRSSGGRQGPPSVADSAPTSRPHQLPHQRSHSCPWLCQATGRPLAVLRAPSKERSFKNRPQRKSHKTIQET